METLIVKVEGKKNASFLIQLLNNFRFVTEVNKENKQNVVDRGVFSDIPITWGTSKPSISDFDELWENRNITLQQLRDKAWKRG
jgi:hypothetical protein